MVAPTPLVAAHHETPSGADEVSWSTGDERTTWRDVAWAPDGSHAVLVGRWLDEEANISTSLVAEWRPEEGLTEVHNESGGGLVSIDIRPDGTQLIVGLREVILYGQPGDYRNLWEESSFSADGNFAFFGLGAGFRPGGQDAVVAGSSLLRVTPEGDLEVIHGGRNAFFRTVGWNPTGTFAWVETAIQREDRAFLGNLWRTNGTPPLASEDNVQVYGRLNPGSALANAISFSPDGTYALVAGRDGAKASVLTWSVHRQSDHIHEDRDEPHDHRWQYQPTSKQPGPITCIDWHPDGDWALATGLDRDVVGVLGRQAFAPLLHQGPGFHGCAFHPDGDMALAVGEQGAVARIQPGTSPLAAVIQPEAGALTPPRENQTFLVDVIERVPTANITVTGWIEADDTVRTARPSGAFWALNVTTADLADGTHTLHIEASTPEGTARSTHTFLVNNDEFTPERPEIQRPTGLEGESQDADGKFTLHWEDQDAPVVYEVEEQLTGSGANATRKIQASGANNVTVHVGNDGSYLYRVRAVNGFGQASPWSAGIVVNVVLDSDGDGVPNSRDPEPFVENVWGDTDGDGVADDREYNQCSDPFDAGSTPSTDDDDDGIPNGIECRQGSDPRDENDPVRQTDPNDTNETPPDEDPPNGSPGPAAGLLIALLAVLAYRRNRS